MITLYQASASAHSASVRMILAAKGLDYSDREIDLAAFEQHEPEFLAVNPAGLVPVLEDGGRRLGEAFLILLYLDERYPEPPLGGGDPRARYQVQKWGKYVETHIAPHLAIVRWANAGARVGAGVVPGFDRLPPERRPLWQRAAEGFGQEEVAASRDALARAAARLEQDLARRDWLAGDEYTLADAAVFPHVRQFSALEIGVPEAVGNWLARVSRETSHGGGPHEVELLPTMGPERGRWG